MTSASLSAYGNHASDVNMKPSGAPTGVVTSLLLTKVTSTNTHTHMIMMVGSVGVISPPPRLPLRTPLMGHCV